MDKFDVVAIGGGPGGCAAAIACAQAGLKVALVEQSPFPRYHPGETLPPGIEVILKQLQVWQTILEAGFLRHDGHYVEWFAPRRFEAFGSDTDGAWLGFQVWRADFDTILLDRAISVGVIVMQPCRALRAIIEGDQVTGVESDRGEIKARFVIDASGNVGWLRRQLPLEMEYFTPKLIARYGYRRGKYIDRDDHPLIIADEDGWTWMARVRPQLYQWTRLNLTGKKLSKDWCPIEFESLQSIGGARSGDVTWRIVEKAAGMGFFMVGDAAAVLDPASSHGVLKAMMSGIMAAHLIKKFLESESNSVARPIENYCFNTYDQWLKSWFLQDINQLREMYFPWTVGATRRS